MKTQRSSLLWLNLWPITLFVVFLTFSPAARASGSATWNSSGTDGNWSTGGNWTPTSGSPPPTVTATFNSGSNNTTINVGTATTIGSIIFDTSSAAAYTLGSTASTAGYFSFSTAGSIQLTSSVITNQLIYAQLIVSTGTSSTLTLENDSTNATLTIGGTQTTAIRVGSTAGTGTHTLDVTGAGNTIISAQIADHSSGSNILSLTKTSTGTLTLSGSTANTYTGLTTVSNGELDLNKTAGVNAIAGVGSGSSADVLVNGGTLKWLANEQLANTANISLTSGTVNLNGHTETLNDFSNSGGTFSTGSGKLIGLGASVTWSGGTNTVNTGGTVEDAHVAITGGTNEVQAGGLLKVDDGGLGLQMTGSTLTLDSVATGTAGELLLGKTTSTSANVTTSTSTTTSVIASGGSATNPGFVDLNGGTSTFTIASGATSKIDLTVGAVVQDGALSKAGAGTLELTGTNTYSGGTTVTAGRLLVDNNPANGSGTGSGSVTASNSGTILGGSGKISGAVTVNTGATLASGAIQTTAPTVLQPGLSLANTLSVSSANLTFALGTGVNGNGATSYSYGTPDENSTYITMSSNATHEITFTGTDSVTLQDLTSATLTLRQAVPYLLIQTGATDNSDFYGLITSSTDNINNLTLDGNGYVMGVWAGSGNPYSDFTTLTVYQQNASGNALTGTAIYPAAQLYLYQGDLEVVPEPGTWALMLGGLALLIFIQRRKARLNNVAWLQRPTSKLKNPNGTLTQTSNSRLG